MYDAGIDSGGGGGYGASVEDAAAIDRARAADGRGSSTATKVPWPISEGTPPAHTCLSGTTSVKLVYAPSQVAAAYGTSAVHETATSKAVRVAVIDLGGGYSPSDIGLAARCFGYPPPTIEVHTGDGVSGQIRNNDNETELDLQTVAAFAPGSTIQLIEATNGPTSLLDAVSRMLGNPHGFPDYASISYAQCAVQESASRPTEATTSVGSTIAVPLSTAGQRLCSRR